MNCLGDQFLAGATLPRYQHRGAGGRYLFDETEDLLHDVRPAHDLSAIHSLTHGPAQCPAFFFFASALDARSDRGGDLLILKWFSNATKRTSLPGGDGGIKGGVGSYHHNRCLWIHLEEFFQRSQAADTWHRDIEQHDIKSAATVSFQSLFSGLGEIDAIAFGGKQSFQNFPHDLFIVDDENRTSSGVAFFDLHLLKLVLRSPRRRRNLSLASSRHKTKGLTNSRPWCPTNFSLSISSIRGVTSHYQPQARQSISDISRRLPADAHVRALWVM